MRWVSTQVCVVKEEGPLKGRKAIQTARHLRSRNISVCCAISKLGTFKYVKQNHPFNRENFLTFMNSLIDKIETDNLGPLIFIMDNVAFHKVREVREKVEAAGHMIKFLPRYSPFLNPIENMFSQWKELVRASRPANEESLMRSIDDVFLRITNENCNSYYRHMMSFLSKCLNKEKIEDG
jgi:transposase